MLFSPLGITPVDGWKRPDVAPKGRQHSQVFSRLFVEHFYCFLIIVPARWPFALCIRAPISTPPSGELACPGLRQEVSRSSELQQDRSPPLLPYPSALPVRLNQRPTSFIFSSFAQVSAQAFRSRPACQNRAGRLLPSTAPSTVSTSSLRASSPSLRRVSLRNSSLRPSLPSTPRIIETSPQQGQEEWVKTTSPLISSSSTVSEVTSGPSAGTLYLVYLFSEGPTFGQPKCIMCHFMPLII